MAKIELLGFDKPTNDFGFGSLGTKKDAKFLVVVNGKSIEVEAYSETAAVSAAIAKLGVVGYAIVSVRLIGK